MKKAMMCLVLLAVFGTLCAHAQSEETTLEALRARFQELGEAELVYLPATREARQSLPDPQTMIHQILKSAPPELLYQAIDRGIQSESMTERVGALTVYMNGTGYSGSRLSKRPEVQSLVMDLLKKDDLTNVVYSHQLVWVLGTFPSRETILAFLEASHRTNNLELQEALLTDAIGQLWMRPPIHSQMNPAEKERALKQMQAWLDRNRDRIRFKKSGRPYLAGGEADDKPATLSAEDRGRIRKDPACVLKLTKLMTGEGGEGYAAAYGPDLVSRCGAALVGPEGARKLQEALKHADAGPPSFDQQMATSSIAGSYPTIDAVQLAVAYVAAYETDAVLRNLAMEIYEDIGTPEIERVLKGEPREVRKKAMALVDQVTGDKDED